MSVCHAQTEALGNVGATQLAVEEMNIKQKPPIQGVRYSMI